MEIQTKPHDVKKEARSLIKHYVIGGKPPRETIEQAGGQVEVYVDVLRTIMSWSGLNLAEVEDAIRVAPDVIENTEDVPNYKPLYFEAVKKMRTELEGKQK